jgi:hypothetical protein
MLRWPQICIFKALSTRWFIPHRPPNLETKRQGWALEAVVIPSLLPVLCHGPFPASTHVPFLSLSSLCPRLSSPLASRCPLPWGRYLFDFLASCNSCDQFSQIIGKICATHKFCINKQISKVTIQKINKEGYWAASPEAGAALVYGILEWALPSSPH